MTQPGEAHAIAERLRRKVAAIPRGATASVGVAGITREGAADVMPNGDRALGRCRRYRDDEAKRVGGNRTRHAESG
jgi:hypothetical protein